MRVSLAFLVSLPSLAVSQCDTGDALGSFWEWSTDGTFMAGETAHEFSGNPGDGVFDTPLFDSADVENANLVGRVQGEFFLHAGGGAGGTWGFNFFEDDSWVIAHNGFYSDSRDAPTPGVVLAGSGQFNGLKASLKFTVLGDDPFAIRWDLCPIPEPVAPFAGCETVVELSAAVEVDGRVFGGVLTADGVGSSDTSTYSTEAAALNATPPVLGLIQAQFYSNAAAGFSHGRWAHYFYEQEEWVITMFGFGDTEDSPAWPNAILGGTGRWKDTVGTNDNLVLTDDPFVISFEMCALTEDISPPTECMMIYELSESGDFGAYTFTGESSGDFDTPFFLTSDTTTGEPAGRVTGQFFNNSAAGNSAGNWNFHFFEEDEWMSARLGFGDEGAAETPDLALGGTGSWANFDGTVRNTVISDDPFVIEWLICPTGVAPPETPSPAAVTTPSPTPVTTPSPAPVTTPSPAPVTTPSPTDAGSGNDFILAGLVYIFIGAFLV